MHSESYCNHSTKQFLDELLTEIKTFRKARLKNEGENGNDAEETAWNDEVDDEIERFAAEIESESDLRVRLFTAVVPDF